MAEKSLATDVQEFITGVLSSGWTGFWVVLGVIIFLGLLGFGAGILLDVLSGFLGFLDSAIGTVQGWI